MPCIAKKMLVRSKKKKVYTFSDVLYTSEIISHLCFKLNQTSAAKTGVLQKKIFTVGSKIPGQDGVVFQGVFNSPPVGNLWSIVLICMYCYVFHETPLHSTI